MFHLAALIAIPYSYEAPDSYVDTNVRGTLNMLRARERGRGAHNSNFDERGCTALRSTCLSTNATAPAAVAVFGHQDSGRCPCRELLQGFLTFRWS